MDIWSLSPPPLYRCYLFHLFCFPKSFSVFYIFLFSAETVWMYLMFYSLQQYYYQQQFPRSSATQGVSSILSYQQMLGKEAQTLMYRYNTFLSLHLWKRQKFNKVHLSPWYLKLSVMHKRLPFIFLWILQHFTWDQID